MSNICKNCNKYFSSKYTLERHIKNVCNRSDIIKNKCEYCEKVFSRSYLLIKHNENCKIKEYKKKINNLEKEIEELKDIIIKYENNEINITENDFILDNFNIYDLLDYGNSLAIYICNNSNILKKISIKDKKKKIIEYVINNNKYRDNGLNLIFFIIKIFKNKIIEDISDKYNINNISNEHIKRMFNIKNNEINEILIKKKNKLYYEMMNIIMNNIV